MEPSHDSPTAPRAEVPVLAPAELVLQTGRLKGNSRPLLLPLTLVGRAGDCDLRLNVEGVAPYHCALVLSPTGLVLRVLQNPSATLVNGTAVRTCVLKHDDVLTIGPIQFQIRIKAPSTLEQLASLQTRYGKEKEALRIQAAAVAAQQGALTEEEAKLQQRRVALDQQEEQLAGHLEDKRRRLLELGDQTRQACAALKAERAAHETQTTRTQREFAAGKRELADKQQQVETERKRLQKLLGRMKRRWHRHWAGERAALTRREEEITRFRHDLEQEREQLQQERAAVHQSRLRFNGEAELGRRQLQESWALLREEQLLEADRQARDLADLRHRSQALDQREADQMEAEQELELHREEWQQTRLELEREVEGLENRVRNYRRKIGELEREVAALDASVPRSQPDKQKEEAEEASPLHEKDDTILLHSLAQAEQPPAELMNDDLPAQPDTLLVPATPAELPTASAEMPAPPPVPDPREALVQERLESLEKLSGELADQRLHLIEQYQRLVQAQQSWREERDTAASDLEKLGQCLQERELAIQQGEAALHRSETALRQQQDEAAQHNRRLESWQAQMTARESAWEGERGRLLTDLQQRETLAQQRLAAVAQLSQRWTRRRRREVEWVQSQRTACEKLRRQCAALREEWLRRRAVLDKEQRVLAERALAMEQYQQEMVGQAANSAAAARRLDRLRSRWAAQMAAVQKAVDEERTALAQERARLEELHAALKKQAARITARDSELGVRQTALEEGQFKTADDINQLRCVAETSQAQRERFEKQIAELRDEVERLARLLLDESESVSVPALRAA